MITKKLRDFSKIPMNKGRNYFFPQEIYALFSEMEKNVKLEKQLMNLKFLLLTGCRYMEATGVTNNDIFDYGFVQFRKTKVRHKIGEVKGKTKPRQKKLTEKQIRELKKFVKKQKFGNDEEIFNFANTTLNRTITKIFIKLKHPFYENLFIKDGVVKSKDGSKVKYQLSCHAFRRTHLNYRTSLGEKFEIMSMELGHSMKTAKDYYLSANLFSIDDKWLINQLLYN